MLNIKTINDIEAPELDAYARLSEAELYHYYEPNGGLFAAESPNVIERALEAGYKPVSFLMEERHLEGSMKPVLERLGHEGAKHGEIPVYAAPLDVLNQLTGFGMTRGVLSLMKRRPLPSLEELLGNKTRIAVLENVMNPTNVGAIFRSAAALGMEAVILTKGSSDPLYRRSARVSMGTVFQIPWTFCQQDAFNEALHALGFKTAAMALCDESIDLGQDSPRLRALLNERKLAVVLGTEGDGLARSTIEECDYTVRIPMSAGVDSLNVAAASAVAFWVMGRPSGNPGSEN